MINGGQYTLIPGQDVPPAAHHILYHP
jgi:hypothetical protein